MTDFDRVALEYINSVDSINVDYSDPITNIEITIGQNVQTVFSVNGLYGEINLTASTVLTTSSNASGVFFYNFEHNLAYLYPIINIYDNENSLVYSNIFVVDENHATITSNIDITGYKAVAQR